MRICQMVTWIRENGFALVISCMILYVCITQGALALADAAASMPEHNEEIAHAMQVDSATSYSSYLR